MLFGADYYPEHWPEERWEEDARLMQEAGFNIVRMAEFAWAKMEPFEGDFQFDWLQRAMDILNRHGIKSIIGTPTASPPPWVCSSNPNILRVNEDRKQITFGHRMQHCINQPAYQKATDRIVRAMAEVISGHDALQSWQIDNEFGQICYCDTCQTEFQNWLKTRYGSLKELNDAWGTIFWSQVYTDWKQVPLPWRLGAPHNPSLALDFKRFVTDSFASYQQRQIDIIRKYSDKPITHNFMGVWPEVMNYQKLTDQLDVVSWDNYPMTAFGVHEPAAVSLSHDLTRGYLKKNFWVMEQLSGPCGWGEMGPSPKPGQLREWTHHVVGRGADAVVYFRWRPCRFGLEQYWHGILNHDGSTNRRYAEIKKTREELTKIEGLLKGTEVKAEVAFLHDYDSRFAFQQQRGNPEFSYVGLFLSLYKGFYSRNIAVDVLSKDWDLSQYKVVVAPAMFVLSRERAEKLREYVANGGTLVMTFRSAVKDETGIIYNEPLPAMLTDVFGICVREYHSPRPDEMNTLWGMNGLLRGITSQAKIWLDLLEMQGATPVAEYDQGFIANTYAVSRNKFGKGKAYYIGTQALQEFNDELMAAIAADAGVEFGMETPAGVDASVRTGENGSLLFITNHTPDHHHIEIPGEYKVNAITGEPVQGTLLLEPYDVLVLR